MKRLVYIFGMIFLSVAVAAQSESCPALVYDSILQASDACQNLGRNEVCYGSTAIDVEARDNSEIIFAQPGDLTRIADIQSIETSPLDANNEEFGVAIMQLQANVPNSLPGQVVTFVLMGDVAMTDASDEGQPPMQTFQFRTGIGEPSCEDVSYDSLLINSPDGLTVTFNVNGIDVELGSTALLIGKPDNMIDMLLVEGEGRVTANGESVTVGAGNWTQIEMDATGVMAIGTPAEPTPFPPERIAHLPFDLLFTGQNVALGKPVTADAFLESDPPENVVNGLATGADNWNAGSEAPHWIEIDLLDSYTISQIRMLTSQFPPEQLDPTIHHILVRSEDESEYREVHVFAEDTRDDQWLEFAPDVPVPNVRYVRVETVSSIHWSSWGEIEVYSAGFVGCIVMANNDDSQLRSGAGTDFDSVGTLANGDRGLAERFAVTDDGFTWWQLDDESWIRDDFVTAFGACDFVPTELDFSGMITVPSGGCLSDGSGNYYDFGGGYFLPYGSTSFSDINCVVAQQSFLGADIVYAPPPFDAMTLCELNGTYSGVSPSVGDSLHICQP